MPAGRQSSVKQPASLPAITAEVALLLRMESVHTSTSRGALRSSCLSQCVRRSEVVNTPGTHTCSLISIYSMYTTYYFRHN
jgi:hypothetical protein